MKFRKKLKKYPQKGEILRCIYPVPCRVKIIKSSSHKNLNNKWFQTEVISVENEGHRIYIGGTNMAYLSEFPKYRKFWDDYCNKMEIEREDLD